MNPSLRPTRGYKHEDEAGARFIMPDTIACWLSHVTGRLPALTPLTLSLSLSGFRAASKACGSASPDHPPPDDGCCIYIYTTFILLLCYIYRYKDTLSPSILYISFPSLIVSFFYTIFILRGRIFFFLYIYTRVQNEITHTR